jgi:UDP-N-acetylglucosamine 4,6-dehydratase
MNIVDLAETMAPGCKHVIKGVRPGEKLHETMVTVDDARRTLEFDDHYVIQPDFPWWDQTKTAGGKPVPERFCYASDTNPEKLSREDLEKMIGEA